MNMEKEKKEKKEKKGKKEKKEKKEKHRDSSGENEHIGCIDSDMVQADNVFIIRVPKNVSIQGLDGIEIDRTIIDDKGKVETLQINRANYELYQEEVNDIYHNFRPLVKRNVSDSIGIGPKFHKAFTLVRKVKVDTNINIDEVIADLPITRAYSKVHQVENLLVSSMPYGSVTSISDLHTRLEKYNDNNSIVSSSIKRENDVSTSTKSKKQKK